ncbi:glycosyltransferase [Metapseudomonas resinovorans]|uniref:glycosyltransferase n=1 Tax=Metapseudomonas resinovorans TaxID=53412 RepID=UPI0009DBCC40|nr:glycosyltransferase [Pseudomonas resinovorans]
MNFESNKFEFSDLSDPLVSLVVPAYNAELYLAETIESILAQSYENIELIVINDGSTDGTQSIMSAYADRCKVVSHENCGQAATLNVGWQISSGVILGYLSADDKLEPTAVECLVSALKRSKSALLVYPDYRLIDEQSRHIRDVIAPEFDHRDVVLQGACPVGPGALFRRELLSCAGGWDVSLRQIPDYDFLLRVGLFGEVVKVSGVLACFRVHGGSQTFAPSDERKTDEYRYVLKKFFDRSDIPDYLRAARPEAEANASVLMARLHLRAGRYLAALRCLKNSIELSASSVFSVQTLRLLLNGLFGRYRHWLMMKIK